MTTSSSSEIQITPAKTVEDLQKGYEKVVDVIIEAKSKEESYKVILTKMIVQINQDADKLGISWF
jgi:hypothetical protein